MTIQEKDLESYREIHTSTYWTDITEEEALIQAQALLSLIKYSLSPEIFDYGD